MCLVLYGVSALTSLQPGAMSWPDGEQQQLVEPQGSESVSSCALEQTKVGWQRKGWSQGGSVPGWPGQAHPLGPPSWLSHQAQLILYHKNKHSLCAYWVPTSVSGEPHPTGRKLLTLTWNYIKGPVLSFPFLGCIINK